MSNEKQSTTKHIDEKVLNPASGMGILFLILIGFLVSAAALVFSIIYNDAQYIAAGVIIFVVGVTVFSILCGGLKIVKPNEALVLTLFGKYYGTIKKDGFFFVNPFATGFNPVAEKVGLQEVISEVENVKKGNSERTSSLTSSKKISTKTMTLNNPKQKVNDVQGNPIIVGSVVIWKVVDPTNAVFNVDNFFEYLSIQCDAIIRNTARLYPYDNIEEEEDEMTLRGSSVEIAEKMRDELQEKVTDAGLEIIEVRLTHLAYAEEIAAAMLRRQQATATIAAREKIVEGAVSMVKMALDQLDADEIVVLDDERKAAMVSNLLVVLCGDKDAQPIVNSGSIY